MGPTEGYASIKMIDQIIVPNKLYQIIKLISRHEYHIWFNK
jgi:hypothetical protein